MINGRISGKTEILGLIGNPVSHTFSPQIHNTIADLLGIDAVYIPFHVLNENVKDAVYGAKALSIRGLNVTVPHKKSVVQFTCGLDPIAEKVNAVNTLRLTEDGYIGYNTDVSGIIRTFKITGVSVSGKNALVIGAGGSANAACIALAECGVNSVTIINRTPESAIDLALNIKKHYNITVSTLSFNDWDKAVGYDIIIQTTTLGFGQYIGISPVLDMRVFDNTVFVLDLVYTPWETAFLKDAKRRCSVCANGFNMLIYQAIAAFEIFMNVKISDSIAISIRHELEKYYLKKFL